MLIWFYGLLDKEYVSMILFPFRQFYMHVLIPETPFHQSIAVQLLDQ